MRAGIVKMGGEIGAGVIYGIRSKSFDIIDVSLLEKYKVFLYFDTNDSGAPLYGLLLNTKEEDWLYSVSKQKRILDRFVAAFRLKEKPGIYPVLCGRIEFNNNFYEPPEFSVAKDNTVLIDGIKVKFDGKVLGKKYLDDDELMQELKDDYLDPIFKKKSDKKYKAEWATVVKKGKNKLNLKLILN